MRQFLAISFLVLLLPAARAADGIDWILAYSAEALPAAPWRAQGQPETTLADGVLTLEDNSEEAPGCFEAEWEGDLDGREIVVEARVKVVTMTGHRGSPVATWPQRDGAPICVEVSDGTHVEGLLLTPPAHPHPGAAPGYARTLSDRFAQVDTEKDFHTYRLVIRGRDMRIERDGKQIIEGRNAFWRPAASKKKTLRFGSTSPAFTGEAQWQFVRLGLRPATGPTAEPSPLKITVGEPWPLNVAARHSETRPYLYDPGEGLLLTSNPQGGDALHEPYGVRRSTDGGKTWTLVPGLDQNVYSPQELVRLSDGRILGPSRWCDIQPDGTLKGVTTILDAKAETFTTHESVIHLPEEFRPEKRGEVLVFERHLWQEDDGSLTAVAWTRLSRLPLPNGRTFVERRSHLLRSDDLGRTWTHHTHIGLGGEPAVVRLSDEEWLCIARPDSHMSNLVQHRSLDGGRTWTYERMLEEGCVMPDLVLMESGVLACSYGRPVSGLMFSLDGGRTWRDHTVVADRAGFNYTAIREIAPGRLLFMDDAQIPGALARIYSCYVDVERIGGE